MPEDDEVRRAYHALPTTSIVEAFFQGTDSIRHFIVSVMEPILTGQLQLDDRQTAVVGTYYRVVGWLKALGQLDSLPHYQAVASGTRSLFELLLDIKLIQSDASGELVRKFHKFPDVERYRSAYKLVTYLDRTNNTRIECANQRRLVDGATQRAAIEALVVKHWGMTNEGKPRWRAIGLALPLPNAQQASVQISKTSMLSSIRFSVGIFIQGQRDMLD